MPRQARQPSSEARTPRASYAKSRDTRARIMAAALAEASDRGFHKTSVARIAARAGVAVGNLNYHFGSREGLIRELMSGLVADLVRVTGLGQSRVSTHLARLRDAGELLAQEGDDPAPSETRLGRCRPTLWRGHI